MECLDVGISKWKKFKVGIITMFKDIKENLLPLDDKKDISTEKEKQFLK